MWKKLRVVGYWRKVWDEDCGFLATREMKKDCGKYNRWKYKGKIFSMIF